MKKRIEIVIGSPVDYKELVAYIYIDKTPVALVNQDEGVDNLTLEFFDDPKLTQIGFDIFLEALLKAKETLLLK